MGPLIFLELFFRDWQVLLVVAHTQNYLHKRSPNTYIYLCYCPNYDAKLVEGYQRWALPPLGALDGLGILWTNLMPCWMRIWVVYEQQWTL